MRFDTPFITGERVQSVKMKFFIEKTGNNISKEDAQYSEEYEKTVWMREARIKAFMQLELEACQEEIIWIRYHNCEALGRPQEEYPARPLPISPNYIYNLKSRLIRVKQGILPPTTLKMILKTDYPPPASPALKTSRTVQSDDTVGVHRDGENSPQDRPRASEEEENMVVDGTSSTDEGGDFISQTEVEVGTVNEATLLADRHFELTILRQQGTAQQKAQIGGEVTPFKQTSGGNPNTVTTAQVAAREEATIGKHRQGSASTDENNQYDLGGTGDDPLISA